MPQDVAGRRLARGFFARCAREVAADLLGRVLVHLVDRRRRAGRIVEAEAYCDTPEPDLACHGARTNGGRPTGRTQVMFGPPGNAFVYFTYGMHWMFNLVTGTTGQANAVLVRALEPLDGLAAMASARRTDVQRLLTAGPARLAQAMGIDRRHNGVDLCAAGGALWLEEGAWVGPGQVSTGPRIGMGKTPEPWFSVPWRYWVTGSPWISR